MNRLSLIFLGFAVLAAEPDRIFVNGVILTMDARDTIAEAVSVGGGKILRAGGSADIRKSAGAETEIVDLKGKTMLPGFYAAHDHFPAGGVQSLLTVNLNSPPMGPITTIEDLVRALKQKAAATPKDLWVVGRGYDDTLLRDRRHPTRSDLDRVSADHPVWIAHTSGHLGVANSRALAIAGITKATPQPKGGRIRIDASSGEPDGVFEETLGPVTRHIPPPSRKDVLEALRRLNKEYLSRGVTTAVVAGGDRSRFDIVSGLSASGELKLRSVWLFSDRKSIPATAAEAKRLASGRARINGVKMWHDGSIQGYTGYLSAPYHRQPDSKADYRGYASRTREQLVGLVKDFHRAGYQVAIHGNGDAAIEDILFAFREAQRDFPRPDARHRIEHCQTPRLDQLDEMKKLGITPSFFVGHVYYWGDRHRELFLGPERAARISPLASAQRRGIRFTVHNDTPVTPVNPLMLVWSAVTRKTRNGSVLGPAERIGVASALRAITSNAAWQNFEEDTKGSIEPGKLADLVILDRNPLSVPPDDIRSLTVVETVIAGETVHRTVASE